MTWLAWLAGAAVGAAAVPLALMPNRWVAAAVIGAWTTAAVLASGRARQASLAVLVLSLQIGLALYLTSVPAVPSVGASWPNSPAVPLASLAAAGALLLRGRGVWSWGGRLAGWTAAMAAATLASLAGSPETTIGASHLLLLGAYYFILLVAANTIRERADLDLVVRALAASLAVQSVVYFVQVFLGGTFTPAGEWIPAGEGLGRFGGTVGARPAMFSSFLLPLVLASAAEVLTSAERGVWVRFGIPALAGTAALFLTFTRASWVGLALGLAYVVVAAGRRRWLRRGRLWIPGCALLALVAALAPRILARAAEDHGAAFEERWALIQMAWRVIEAHPLAGVGAGAYPYVFRDYLTPDLADRWLYVVHNVYVLRAAETGLPGALAWIGFLAAAFRLARPERMRDTAAQRLALGWRAGLLALAWEMLWDVSVGPAANSLLWFLCGVMIAAGRLREANVEQVR
jgi:O-antigen ligase